MAYTIVADVTKQSTGGAVNVRFLPWRSSHHTVNVDHSWVSKASKFHFANLNGTQSASLIISEPLYNIKFILNRNMQASTMLLTSFHVHQRRHLIRSLEKFLTWRVRYEFHADFFLETQSWLHSPLFTRRPSRNGLLCIARKIGIPILLSSPSFPGRGKP